MSFCKFYRPLNGFFPKGFHVYFTSLFTVALRSGYVRLLWVVFNFYIFAFPLTWACSYSILALVPKPLLVGLSHDVVTFPASHHCWDPSVRPWCKQCQVNVPFMPRNIQAWNFWLMWGSCLSLPGLIPLSLLLPTLQPSAFPCAQHWACLTPCLLEVSGRLRRVMLGSAPACARQAATSLAR